EAGRAAASWALSLDYRLAPEHPFPAAVEDALAGYRFLLGRGFGPGRIAIAGDSAGGGLVVAALLAIREAGLAQPACGWCVSARRRPCSTTRCNSPGWPAPPMCGPIYRSGPR